MYESFFGLSERPFAAAPNPACYVPVESAESARQTLARSIERAEGPGLLVGPAGCGKSLLCGLLAEQFRESFHVALLSSARLCTRRALLQNILFEMNLPFRQRDEGELRLSLIDHLQPGGDRPDGLLLIVDEAHVLPLRLLEEIRMITNLVRNGQPRVRLLMAGGALLEERFANPRMEVFNQRIAARCYLQPLNRDETMHYVAAQISAAGGKKTIFDQQALQAVYSATDGIPRLVNQVCDHAMVMACAGGVKQIDAAGVQEAWADLQQLPAPWRPVERTGDEPSSVIEFGRLDDDEAAMTGDDAGDELEPLDAVQQIDEIQLRVAEIQEDDRHIEAASAAGDDFQPAASKPEVELIFHGAHDPFSDPFEHEEVVIDRYASLDSDSLRLRPRVKSAQQHNLVEMISPGNESRESGQLPAPSRTAISEAARCGGDDRDIIVADTTDEESAAAATSNRPRSNARRMQYRQLFVSLRSQ